ncbi:hypothetical protein ACQPXH_26485 [Nocardia sp. CA-135953]|uniref:hypothetical protein n=1 Tax=Nocardia sp. CA-135953 TaxID=3239978 RepID=UPI003D990A8E
MSHATLHGGQADPADPDFGATRIKAGTPPSHSSPLAEVVEADGGGRLQNQIRQQLSVLDPRNQTLEFHTTKEMPSN